MGHTWTEHCSRVRWWPNCWRWTGEHFQRRRGWSERKRGREGGREIIIERKMCHPRGLLLIASLMSLRDMFLIDWMWIQLRRLGGVGISAQQTTAQFDMSFSFLFNFSFLPDIATWLPGRTPSSEVARLWWIGILWVSNPLCGSLMRRRKNSAAPASSIKNSIKGTFLSHGTVSVTRQGKKKNTFFCEETPRMHHF